MKEKTLITVNFFQDDTRRLAIGFWLLAFNFLEFTSCPDFLRDHLLASATCGSFVCEKRFIQAVFASDEGSEAIPLHGVRGLLHPAKAGFAKTEHSSVSWKVIYNNPSSSK